MFEFIHNLARGHMATACFYLVSSAMVEENCWKERLRPTQTSIFACTELNTYSGRPKWYKFEVDSDVKLNWLNSINFTMFSGLESFKQVKIYFSNSAHEKFDFLSEPTSDNCSHLFLNLKLYFYQEKISLTQKVLA